MMAPTCRPPSSRPSVHDGLVLIALTGWGQEEARRRSRAAGFDHHLIKPVDLDALQALLVSLGPNKRLATLAQ